MIRETQLQVEKNEQKIEHLEQHMNKRFDTLEEDLEATMSDTHKLKLVAGMVSDE